MFETCNDGAYSRKNCLQNTLLSAFIAFRSLLPFNLSSLIHENFNDCRPIVTQIGVKTLKSFGSSLTDVSG